PVRGSEAARGRRLLAAPLQRHRAVVRLAAGALRAPADVRPADRVSRPFPSRARRGKGTPRRRSPHPSGRAERPGAAARRNRPARPRAARRRLRDTAGRLRTGESAGMQKFVAELRRRNVIRVAVAYLAVGWLILQAGDVLAGVFELKPVV